MVERGKDTEGERDRIGRASILNDSLQRGRSRSTVGSAVSKVISLKTSL